jgi:GT2 family glycosyltransferase
VDVVRQGWPSVAVIRRTTNAGFAAANNEGIRATRGELILLLNNDTVVAPGAIDALIGTLLADRSTAIAGPRLVDGDGVAELSFGPMISPIGELRQKLTMWLHGLRFGPATRWVERVTRREHYVDWVSGAALLVRRADADAVGLLDERYFLYMEDVDFCAAVRARGRRVLFTPAAEVVHLRGRSRATAPAMMNEAYRRSQIAFYEKYHPGWAPMLKLYLSAKGQLPPRGGSIGSA